MNIRFTSSLTPDDENTIAPVVLQTLAGILNPSTDSVHGPHRHIGFEGLSVSRVRHVSPETVPVARDQIAERWPFRRLR